MWELGCKRRVTKHGGDGTVDIRRLIGYNVGKCGQPSLWWYMWAVHVVLQNPFSRRDRYGSGEGYRRWNGFMRGSSVVLVRGRTEVEYLRTLVGARVVAVAVYVRSWLVSRFRSAGG